MSEESNQPPPPTSPSVTDRSGADRSPLVSTRPSDDELSAMTLNERLWVRGLFAVWYAAARARRRDEMIAILCQVALTSEQAACSVDRMLATPAKYGF